MVGGERVKRKVNETQEEGRRGYRRGEKGLDLVEF